MSKIRDFVIEDGTLIKYNGKESHVTIPDSVTYIRYSAFRGCKNIKSVHISKNVVEMDESCMVFNDDIESITVDPENSKFASENGMVFSAKYQSIQFCPRTKMGEVVLPDTVCWIAAKAFRCCTQITKIYLPPKLRKIGHGAFEGCCALTEITLPEKVTTIPYGAFEGCVNLEKVTLPDGLVAIEQRAFYGCNSLKTIVLPPHIGKLGMDVFPENTVVICSPENFKKLTTPVKETTCIAYLEESERFPENLAEYIVTYIKKNKSDFFERLIRDGNANAFKMCLDLFKVTKTIIDECLELTSRYNRQEMNFVLLDIGNKSPKKITKEKTTPEAKPEEVAEKEQGIDEKNAKDWAKVYRWEEGNGTITLAKYKGTDSCVEIPGEIGGVPVTRIRRNAFKGNKNLEEVHMALGIEEIEESAFEGCEKLSKIVWNDSLKIIGKRAFFGCYQLTVIRLPAGVVELGVNSFSAKFNYGGDGPLMHLSEVYLPEGVKVFKQFLGSDGMENNLVDVYFLGEKTKIKDSDFLGHVRLHVPAGSKTEEHARKLNYIWAEVIAE